MLVVEMGKVLRFQVCRTLRQKEDVMCVDQQWTAAGDVQTAEQQSTPAEHVSCSQSRVGGAAMRHMPLHGVTDR
jgi:hypothetical protein